jgi:hypothetical protein
MTSNNTNGTLGCQVVAANIFELGSDYKLIQRESLTILDNVEFINCGPDPALRIEKVVSHPVQVTNCAFHNLTGVGVQIYNSKDVTF